MDRHTPSELHRLEARCRSLKNDNLLLQNDNLLLRDQISRMTSSKPIHDQQWFVSEFKQIDEDIEEWVCIETQATPVEPISVAQQTALCDEIATWGDAGRHDSELVRPLLMNIQQNEMMKILLIRHIVAVLLFESVLDRFAFGYTREQCSYLEHMELDLCSYGSHPPSPS